MWRITDNNIPDDPMRVAPPDYDLDLFDYNDPVCKCDKCGKYLYEGDYIYDILPGGEGICEECLDDYRRTL